MINPHLVKRTSVLVLFLLTLLCITSCSQTSAKSEKAIRQDIFSEDSYYSKYNLLIDSFSFSRRQTNNGKTDNVWAKVIASNDDFTYCAEYHLVYVLYNDGWILEDYDRDDHSICPAAKSLTWKDADVYITSLGYQNWEHAGVQGRTTSHTFFYLVYENGVTKQISLTYTFSPDKLWGEPKVSEVVID